MGVFTYWAFFGTIYLLILTYQDLRHNMMIDDRKNFFMMGLSVSLLSHMNSIGIFYLLLTIVLIIFSNWFLKKSKILGDGDVSALNWMLYGFVLISPIVTIWFCIIWVVVTMLDGFIKRFIAGISGKLPYFQVLLISFVLTCFIFRIY